MRRGDDAETEIRWLVNKVQNLSLELSEARKDLWNLQEQINVDDTAQVINNRSSERVLAGKGKRKAFRIGDQVVIIDNYRGNKGKKGKVVGVTVQQVILKLEDEELQVRKWKENVRKVKLNNKVGKK